MTSGAAFAALVPTIADFSEEKLPPPAALAERARRSSVRVEHELIVAKTVVEPAPSRVATPRARPRPRADVPRRDTGFFSRARQWFVGDGRHRPAPFPRAGQ